MRIGVNLKAGVTAPTALKENPRDTKTQEEEEEGIGLLL